VNLYGVSLWVRRSLDKMETAIIIRVKR